MSSLEVSDLKCSKGFELKCKCGLTAGRRVSRTRANLFRLFYNCPKSDFADVSMHFLAFTRENVVCYLPHVSYLNDAASIIASNVSSLSGLMISLQLVTSIWTRSMKLAVSADGYKKELISSEKNMTLKGLLGSGKGSS